MIRVGINGFGRIGRTVFRILSDRDDIAVTRLIRAGTGANNAGGGGGALRLTDVLGAFAEADLGLPIVLAAFMFFVTPTYFRPMFSSIVGWALLVFGGFMIFIGNLIIRRVVAIEV